MAMGGATQVTYMFLIDMIGNGASVAVAIIVALAVYVLSLWITKAIVRMISIKCLLSVSDYGNDKQRRIGSMKKNIDIQPLVDVVAKLRAPDGCPWDKVQTHESLRRYFIEETYEVVDAIDNKDMHNLREELGDVLLQVVFHSSLAEESGSFSLQDVINDVTER